MADMEPLVEAFADKSDGEFVSFVRFCEKTYPDLRESVAWQNFVRRDIDMRLLLKKLNG